MPRPAKIWKREANGWYYATINGRKEKLSQSYNEAKELFHGIMNAVPKAPAGRREGLRLGITLEELSNAFLTEAKASKSPRTFENQYKYLQSFCDFVGKTRKARAVTPAQYQDWLRHSGWGKSTQAVASATIKACFNWAVKTAKWLLESPLWGQKRLKYVSRKRILKQEEKTKIENVIAGPFKDLWMFLEMTGCRPFSEAAKVTASMVDWDEGTITFENHKTEHQGKDRVIYLPPQLLARMKELAEEHPEGPLMRTKPSLQHPEGRAWHRDAACKAMRRLEKKAAIKRLAVYAARHTYITDCLAKGMSPTVVGRLVGNSARTIAKFYEHVDQRRDVLKDAAIRAIS